MKSQHFAFLIFVVALVFGSNAYASQLIADNFDSYTPGSPPGGGWSTDTNGMTVLTDNSVSVSPNNSVGMVLVNNDGTGYLEHTHTPVTEQVTYEAYLRTNNTANETITMSARNNGWPPGPWLAMGFNSGYLSYYDGSSWQNIISITANQWYQVRIVVDVPSRTYDIYVDNMSTPEVVGADFWDNTVTSLDRLRFEVYQTGGADPESGDAAWVDNVLVTTPELARIPTLSEWGMIVFALLLCGSALWYMRRRSIA